MRTRRDARVAILLLAALAPACNSGPAGGPCTAVADCVVGEICAGGRCGACSADVQCEADYGVGSTCADGTCGTASCTAGTLGCSCDNSGCAPDSRCNANDVCEACTAGLIGCDCEAAEICSAGECVQGTCVDCERGSESCRCYDGGSCDAGLRCTNITDCEVCPAGEQGCACRTSGAPCDADLLCDNSVCISDPCPDGTVGCPCRATGDACTEDLYCADNDLCAPCSNDIAGCPCDSDDTCQNDLICALQTGLCRESYTCAALTCAAYQLCQEGATPAADAVCAPECETGWRWNAGGESCDELSCDGGDVAGSIANECAGQHRTCVENLLGGAVCGACLSGYTDGGGTLPTCRQVFICADLDCAARNRACTPETANADASCAECLPWYFDAGFACRAIATCADLGCAALNRDCTAATAESDALCGDCVASHLDVDGTCVERNCDAGVPASRLDECDADHRVCVEDLAYGAQCGACIEGWAENGNGQCQTTQSCLAGEPDFVDCAAQNRVCIDDGEFDYCGDCKEGTTPDAGDPPLCVAPISCADLVCGDQFCIDGGPGENAHCEAAPCDEDFAWSDYSNQCVLCIVQCTEGGGVPIAGSTGRIWPFTLQNSDRCICETAPGYYWNDGGIRGPRPCDADLDGWLRGPARDAVRESDAVLAQNARCELQVVDRMVLRNEAGQELPVFLCSGDPYFTLDPDQCSGGTRTIDLAETLRNDDQVTLDDPGNATEVPTYVSTGGNGRALRAEEINGLTRACVSEGADFNHNGLSDYREWHGMDTSSLSADQVVYASFGFFVELHRGFYRTGNESVLVGEYVIEERSRCTPDGLALHYGDLSDYGRACEADAECGPAGTCTAGRCVAEYWRGCTRSRDATYSEVVGTTGNPDTPNFGLDFARFSCSAASGSCPIPPPFTDEPPIAGDIPLHGLCDVPPQPPEDDECRGSDANTWPCVNGGVWRGMSHHSQFRCVVVRDTEVSPPTEPVLLPARFSSGEYRLNLCHVACPDGDCSTDCDDLACVVSSEGPTSAPNPSHAVLACDVDATSVPGTGTVGWATVMYAQAVGGAYTRGCINEWSPTTAGSDPREEPEVYAWRALCPGWEENSAATSGDGDAQDFGQALCGCGYHYGGPDCDLGCPDPELHYADGYSPTPRRGYWLCGDFTASAYDQLDMTYGPALVGLDDTGATWVLHSEVPLSSPGGAVLCQDPGDCTNGYAVY